MLIIDIRVTVIIISDWAHAGLQVSRAEGAREEVEVLDLEIQECQQPIFLEMVFEQIQVRTYNLETMMIRYQHLHQHQHQLLILICQTHLLRDRLWAPKR